MAPMVLRCYDPVEYDEDEYEEHDVPFGAIYVNAFASPELCEAVRMFWRPTLQRPEADPVEAARQILNDYLHRPDFDGFIDALSEYGKRRPEFGSDLQPLIASVERVREKVGPEQDDDEDEDEDSLSEEEMIAQAAAHVAEADGDIVHVVHKRQRDSSKPVDLDELLAAVRTKGEQMLWGHAKGAHVIHRDGFSYSPGLPIKVRIVLTYPLHQEWEHIVTISASEFGSVFEIGYQMYKHIYALDDAAWRSEGQNKAPRCAPHMSNRARGKYIWGHDMSDLVYEGLMFRPEPGVDAVVPGSTHERGPQLVGTVRFILGS
jgi:hypothetical protein